MTKQEIRSWLHAEAEPGYQKFSSALIPGCETMLGIRIPVLRKKAKEIVKEDWRGFLKEYGITEQEEIKEKTKEKQGKEENRRKTEVKEANEIKETKEVNEIKEANKIKEVKETEEANISEYFEEKQLQAMVLGYRKVKREEEAKEMLRLTAAFIPKIQNWSVNDTFCTGFVLARTYPDLVWEFLMGYRESEQEFEQRVVAVILMSHYLNDAWIDRVLAVLENMHHEGYYQKMGVAWALATAFAKYPEKTMTVLKSGHLDSEVYQKAIQKMLESYRVSPEDKEILRAMKKCLTKSMDYKVELKSDM